MEMLHKPWETESDLEAWTDPITGYLCRIERSPFKTWNGYVGIPSGHPWFQATTRQIYATVHGGLTFAGFSPEWVSPFDAVSVWWVGFDCNHGCDFSPEFAYPIGGQVYRDERYVMEQVVNLAVQIKEASHT